MDEPSMTEEQEMLLEEKDSGDAGRCVYDSLFMLELLCNCGPPEREELASVTRELAPILGPDEFAALLRTL